MSNKPRATSGSDGLLESVILGILRARDAGQPVPALSEMQARYPNWAEELAVFYDGDEPAHALQQLGAPPGGSAPTADETLLGACESAAAPRPGRLPQIPGYEVLEELGRGAMGVVYKVRHLKANFLVALKMIRAGPRASPEEVEHFVREIELHASLDHDHIVPIFHVGEHEGVPYFTMKLVETGTLRNRLNRYRLRPRDSGAGKRRELPRGMVVKSARRIARLIARVAEAVHYAHQHGLLHRDLKPGNILLHGKGHPYVADFGLVMRIDEAGGAGPPVGTAPYMAPEQTLEGVTLSTAVDVYGLGAILYELLTGRPPFAGCSTAEILEQVRGRSPEPPSQIVPGAPHDLEQICLKCLEKDPSKRFQSARHVARFLTDFAEGKPVPGITPWWRKVTLWARRKPAAAALAAVVTATLGLALGLGIQKYRENQDALRRAEADNYESSIRDAANALAKGRYGSALDTLSDCPDRLKNVEWHFLRSACQPDEVLRLRHGSHVRGIVSDLAGGQRIATAGMDGQVILWDAADGHQIAVLQASSKAVCSLASGHRGRYLAAAGEDDAVSVWEVTADGAIQVLKENAGNRVAVARDVARVAAAGRNQRVEVWDLPSSRPVRSLEYPGVVHCLALSPDGKSLTVGGMIFGAGPRTAAANKDSALKFWDLAEGREPGLFQVDHRIGSLFGLAWGGPDQRRYLVATTGLTAVVWDASTGRMTEALPGYEDRPVDLTFDQQGRYLAASFANRSIKIWNFEADPQLVFSRTIVRDDERPGSVSVSLDPKGERLAYVRGRDVIVERWKNHGGVRTEHGHCFAVSPDGKYLAAASDDGSVQLLCLDRNGGPPIRIPATGDVPLARVASLAFSPDGAHVAIAKGKAVWVWGPNTGREPLEHHAHAGNVLCVAYSPVGHLLASSDDQGNVQVWDTDAGQAGPTLQHAEAVRCVAFSPDGKHLAAGCLDRLVTLWDSSTWTKALLAEHQLGVTSVAFSPDGRWLASGSDDQTVRLWKVRPGAEERSRKVFRHDVGVGGVAFSREGQHGWRLLSVGQDGVVRFWNPSVRLGDEESSTEPELVRRELLALTRPMGRSPGVQIGFNSSPTRLQLITAFGDDAIEIRDGDLRTPPGGP
jgi:WD40 repeat protein